MAFPSLPPTFPVFHRPSSVVPVRGWWPLSGEPVPSGWSLLPSGLPTVSRRVTSRDEGGCRPGTQVRINFCVSSFFSCSMSSLVTSSKWCQRRRRRCGGGLIAAAAASNSRATLATLCHPIPRLGAIDFTATVVRSALAPPLINQSIGGPGKPDIRRAATGPRPGRKAAACALIRGSVARGGKGSRTDRRREQAAAQYRCRAIRAPCLLLPDVRSRLLLHRHLRQKQQQGHVGLLLLDRRSGSSVRYDTAVAPMILPLRNRLAQRLNRTRSSIDPKASFTSAALLSDQRLFGEERVCPLDGIPGGCGARSHPPSLLGDNKRLPPFLQIFRCTRDCSDYPDDGSLCINTSGKDK